MSEPPLEPVPAPDLIRLRTSLAAARSLQGLIVTNARRELRLSEQLGIHASADPVRVKNYCTMSTEDYRRYRATQDLR